MEGRPADLGPSWLRLGGASLIGYDQGLWSALVGGQRSGGN